MIHGALLAFAIYHHSLILVYFISESSNYSDWVKFTNSDISFSVVLILLILVGSGLILQSIDTPRPVQISYVLPFDRLFLRISSVIALALVVMLYLYLGGSLSLSKQEIFSGGFSIIGLLQYPLMIIFLASVVLSDRTSILFSLLALIGFSIFMVSRSIIILPILGAIFFYVYNHRISSLVTPLRVFTLVSIVFIAIYGKLIALGIRTGNFEIFLNSLEGTNLAGLMEGLEGYFISYHFVDIVNSPRYYNWINSFDALYQLLVFPDLFGADSQSFTVYLSEHYRPSANFGLAYTYFGEGFAVGGFIGVAGWTILLVVQLLIVHCVLKKAENIWVLAWACFAMSILCFYYPRNSMEINLAMFRLSGLSALGMGMLSFAAKKLFIMPKHKHNVLTSQSSAKT